MILYAALHNPMTEESSAHTISVHFSTDGAESAIQKSKDKVKAEHMKMRQHCLDSGDSIEMTDYCYSEKDWDQWCWWGIAEIEVLP